jgi:hypothetical protein
MVPEWAPEWAFNANDVDKPFEGYSCPYIRPPKNDSLTTAGVYS